MKIQNLNLLNLDNYTADKSIVEGQTIENVDIKGIENIDISDIGRKDIVQISREGLEKYYASHSADRQKTYEETVFLGEILPKIVMDLAGDYYSQMGKISEEALDKVKKQKDTYNLLDIAQADMSAYAKVYDQIEKGYADGTKEVWELENGSYHKLTKEEHLKYLDEAYERSLKDTKAYLFCQEGNAWARKNFGDGRDYVLPNNYQERVLDSMREARTKFVNQYNGKEKEDTRISNARCIASSSLQSDSKFWDSIQFLFENN